MWFAACRGACHDLECLFASGSSHFGSSHVGSGVVCKQRGLFASLILPIGCRSLVVLPFFSRVVRPRSQFSPLSVFSFLVACFAAVLPGPATMGRKDRNYQNSQDLSNSALFEVSAQVKLQNQEFVGTAGNTAECKRGGFQMEPKLLEMAEPASGSSAHPASLTVEQFR